MEELTKAQKLIWITEQYYKNTSINIISGTAIFEEKMDFKNLKKAIEIVCTENDNFRLKFKIKDGKLMQYISKDEIQIKIIEVKDYNEMLKEREKIIKKPFTIEDSILFNFDIYKFNDETGAMVLTMHHLIGDGWTNALVCQEVARIYNKLIKKEYTEDEKVNSYIEYAKIEQEYIKSERFQKDKKYWEEKFKKIPETAVIPGSKTESNIIDNPKAKRKEYQIEQKEIEKLKEYCKINKISLYNFFMAIYAIYISEITNLDEFVIGTPTLNRSNAKEKNTMGMFINMLPLKINLSEAEDFKTFIKNISTSCLGMLKHQKYTYQCLLENLREKYKNIPKLYNILLSYQITNTTSTKENTKYRTEWTFNGYCAEDMDIQIFDLNDTGNLNIAYDYRISKYSEEDIEKIHKRILNIIKQVIKQENILLKNIDIVTPEEKEILINTFNKTKLEYDNTKTIIQLFEEQVEKTPNKVAIICNKKKLTYKELNQKTNMLASEMLLKDVKPNDIIGIMLNRSVEMIIAILATLKCGATYLPIDPEYPQERISYMIENSQAKLILTNQNTQYYVPKNCLNINLEYIKNKNIENKNIKIQSTSLAYLIYTSGSTGKPKGVKITHKNLNNFIQGVKQKIDFNSKKVMVSLTTICFDIFGLEIWCALSNGLTLVIANEEEQNNPELLNKLCIENNVNIMQTTPSRYSIIFEEKNNLKFLENITDILIGGEAVNKKILETIQKNSKARIFNMYGPTETTIWSTIKELTNEENITIGKPIANTQCYILNKNKKALPIGVAGELYIGGDGVSKGYLNRENLNKEKFIQSPFINGEKIYNTGDLAVFTENGEIMHLGRTDFQVKIRGFRVELGEIENAIEKNTKVIKTVVAKQKMKNGNDALIAYYTANTEQNINKELKEELKQCLPQYMVPQYFVKLEKMPYTPNGKIDRKALPEPEKQDNKKEIIKPRNKLDKELIQIIKEVLKEEKISILDTLTDLGADSLNAITISIKILSKYKVQVNIKNLLSNYTIKDISDYIEKNGDKKVDKLKIAKAPEKEDYPMSSAQKRIYYNCKLIGENNTVYNMPGAIIIPERVNKNKIKDIFQKIIERHSVLRTEFVLKENEVVQKIQEKVDLKLPIYQNKEEDIPSIIENFAKPFNLEKAPLLRIEIHYIENKKTLLLFETHHIIMDGTSLNNMISEFSRLYNGENLEIVPIQYKDYAVWENNYNQSENIKQAENYWLNKFKDSEFSQLNLPYDYKIPTTRSYKGNKISNILEKEEFEKIENTAKEMGISPYILFMSAFLILLYKYTGQEEIILGTPIANRDIEETEKMLGMFVNNIAIRGNVNTKLTFKEFATKIKEQILDDLSFQPYPYDMLVKKLGLGGDNSKNPLFDVMFTYQNNETKDITLHEEKAQILELNNKISKFNLSFEIKPKTHAINIEYCTDLFKKQTIDRLFEHYMNIIKTIIFNDNIKIEDISIISEKEKNKILYEFNDTKVNFMQNKTVIDMIEEQVEKNPNKVAVIFENEKITYKMLNEKANQLASYIRKMGIEPNDIVGIMLPRSFEVISTIIGVMKAGACYIPIDPTYPKERIQYMLEDSNAKILITNDELYNNIKHKNKICANYDNFDIYKEETNNLNKINKQEDLAYVIYTSGSTGKPKGVKITHKNLFNFINGIKKVVDFNKNKVMVSVTTICFDIFGLEMWGTLTSGMTLVMANENEQNIPSLLNQLCIKHNVNMIQTTPSRYALILEEDKNGEFLENITDILVGGEPVSEGLMQNIKSKCHAKIFDLYGPTETTIWSTAKELTNEETVTIGYPIANTQVYVLDKELQVVPIGIAGELYIAGDGVGQGYINREEITKERYIKNPYVENSIMYKTGDICKFEKTGELCYLGREDGQVKVRGLRIELEEIENKILEFHNIKKAKVVKQQIGNREIISAYYISNKRIEITELRSHLHKYLPNYMIPSYYTALDEFPYTPNGKIDKNSLPIPNGILQNEKSQYIAPKTNLEIKLVAIWEEILNTKPIGIKDNFFELGGDSILAMNLNMKILKLTDKIKYSDIFTYPTILELAEKIESDLKQETKDNINCLENQYKEILENNMIIPKEIQYHKPGNILLTGATGFLGIHILEKLLTKETGQIYILVRKEPGFSIKEKCLNKLHYYFGNKYDKYIDNKIKIIQADITQDGFGLNQEELFKLGNSIDAIINSVAKVSHYGSYKEFYNVNVKSVEKIIDFANAFNKKVFHISTLSVSGNALVDQHYAEQKFEHEVKYCENNFYIGQSLENVYVRSKFEAERKILDAIANGTDAYILRMGNLMPRLSDGKFQENINQNAYISRLKTFDELQCIPEYLENNYLELTPIDCSAEAILKIIQYSNKNNRIYHIFNHNYIFITDLLKIMNELKFNLKSIKNDEFKEIIRTILKGSNSDKLNAIINDLDKDLNLNYDSKIKLDSKHSISLLKLYGFEWPTIEKKYIKNLLKLIKGEKEND